MACSGSSSKLQWSWSNELKKRKKKRTVFDNKIGWGWTEVMVSVQTKTRVVMGPVVQYHGNIKEMENSEL